MNSQTLEQGSKYPSWYFVGLALCFANIIWAAVIFLIEYVMNKELSGVGTLSTIIPAMSVGYYFGYANGCLMPSSTRWKALSLWFAVTLSVFSLLLIVDGFSLYELAVGLGWFNLVIVFILLITLLLTYFVLKHAEKIAVKSLEKAKLKKAEQTKT